MVSRDSDPSVSPQSPQQVARALEQLLCLLAKEIAKQLLAEAQASGAQSTIDLRITCSRDSGRDDRSTPSR